MRALQRKGSGVPTLLRSDVRLRCPPCRPRPRGRRGVRKVPKHRAGRALPRGMAELVRPDGPGPPRNGPEMMIFLTSAMEPSTEVMWTLCFQ